MRFATSTLAVCLLAGASSAQPHLVKRLFGSGDASTTTTSIDVTPSPTAAAQQTTTAVAATTTALVVPTTKQKAVRNEFWHNFKARGVNLGNWLLLEEWMDPSFYRNYSSAGTDEWTFCEKLGTEKCASALTKHWDSWVTEADIDQLAQYGFNTLRIPIGHWALVPTTTDEPYVHSTQMQQVERAMGYASKNGMYVVLDIHGLPGSQNGKEHSGHEGQIGWYSAANQKRSLAVVAAAVNFIYQSPNKAVVAALEIMNEPNITSSSQQKTYEKYISSAEKMIHSVNSSMPIMFHDGFKGISTWSKFTKDQKKNYVLDVHQYFQEATDNSISAVQTTCNLASTQSKSKSATPVFVGEFSLSIGGAYPETNAWRQQFYETQVKAYSGDKFAGSAFWSLRARSSDGKSLNNGWSIQSLINSSAITTRTWSLSNTIECPKSKSS